VDPAVVGSFRGLGNGRTIGDIVIVVCRCESMG
jgi:hypothetical protein